MSLKAYRNGATNNLLTWGAHVGTNASFTAVVSDGSVTGTVTAVAGGACIAFAIDSWTFSEPGDYQFSTETGTGSALIIHKDGDGNYTIPDGGSGHTVGDVWTCSNEYGSAQVTISIVTGIGQVTGVSFGTQTGEFYPAIMLATENIIGTGSGLTITTDSSGQAASIYDAGNGYSVGDTFSVVDLKCILRFTGTGGSGYILPQTVTITDSTGADATAHTTVVAGALSITLDAYGSGYTSPTVTLTETAAFPTLSDDVDLQAFDVTLAANMSCRTITSSGGSFLPADTSSLKTLTLGATGSSLAGEFGSMNITSASEVTLALRHDSTFAANCTWTNVVPGFIGATFAFNAVVELSLAKFSPDGCVFDFTGGGDLTGPGGAIIYRFPAVGSGSGSIFIL